MCAGLQDALGPETPGRVDPGRHTGLLYCLGFMQSQLTAKRKLAVHSCCGFYGDVGMNTSVSESTLSAGRSGKGQRVGGPGLGFHSKRNLKKDFLL